jgi:hypothetical protein
MPSCHMANIFIFFLHQSIFITEKYQKNKKASPQDSSQTKPLGEYIQQQDRESQSFRLQIPKHQSQ